jgi:hypothetical protein
MISAASLATSRRRFADFQPRSLRSVILRPSSTGRTANDSSASAPGLKIEADMKPLAKTLATMEPIVAGYAVTRWKIAGAFALDTTLITTLGWIVSLFAGKIITWIFSLFR